MRRFLDTEFVAKCFCESPTPFKARIQNVEDLMKSDDFKAEGGSGLEGSSRDLLKRCPAPMYCGSARNEGRPIVWI